MQILLAFFGTAARGIVSVYSLLLLIRVILPFIPMDEDNPFENFIYTVTEPLLHFVRGFVERIPGASEMPIDISIIVAYLLLNLIELFLLVL